TFKRSCTSSPAGAGEERLNLERPVMRPRSGAASRSVLDFELHQERGEAAAESFDTPLLLGVFQGPIRVERLVRLGDGDLVRQNDYADAAEDRADVEQPSQTAKATWGCTH